MRRLALAPLVAIAVALSQPARADDTIPSTTLAGVQVSVAGGPSFATPREEVNIELTGAGWPAMSSVSPEFQIRFGLTAFNVTLDARFGGSDVSYPGRAGAEEGFDSYSGAIGANLGYRLRLGPALTFSPFVGVASLNSTLCFAGLPDATSATSRPPFEQVLRNPGRNTCLKASVAGIEVGLAVAWNLRLPFESGKAGTMAGYLGIGPRVGYTLPFSSSRTWEQSSSELKSELPPFEGPLAPIGGAFAGIEVQFHFALEETPGGPS